MKIHARGAPFQPPPIAAPLRDAEPTAEKGSAGVAPVCASNPMRVLLPAEARLGQSRRHPLLSDALLAPPSEGPTAIERARATVQGLSKAYGALGAEHHRTRQELEIGASLLTVDGTATYGALRDVLDRLNHAPTTRKPAPAELTTRVEEAFLRIYVDYLAATGEALRGWIAEAETSPNLATVSHLEEQERYARWAARGGGKSENVELGRRATRLAPRHPELAPTVTRARQRLSELTWRAHEVRMDLVGVEASGLSLDERARLLALDKPCAAREAFDERLDAVESALAQGAYQFASSLLWEVERALPSLSHAKIAADTKQEPLDELTFAAQRSPGDAPLSLAETEALTRRLDALRPTVVAVGREQSLVLMQLLLDRGLASPRNVEKQASSLIADLQPALVGGQLARAQALQLRAFETRLNDARKTLEAAAAVLATSEVLDEQNNSAAKAAVRAPSTIEPVEELSFLGPEAKAALDSALAAYEQFAPVAQTTVEGVFARTLEAVQAQYALIQALAVEEQLPRLKALHRAAGPMESLYIWLPAETTAAAEALTREIYERAFPERRSAG
jgi:hypothetical protein